MDKNSFLIYLDYEEQFNLLTDEQIGQLMRAIMKYEKTRELPQLEGMLKMAFSFIKTQLDRNREKYEKQCEKNRENGKKGGRPKKQEVKKKPKKPNGFEKNPTKPKKADNDNEDDNDKDNDDDNVDVADVITAYENNIAPATQMSSEMLIDYCNDLSPSLVLEAIKKAVLANKRNGRYIHGILRDWDNKGFKKLIDVKNEEQEFKKTQEDTTQVEESEEEKIKRKTRELEEAMKNGNK